MADFFDRLKEQVSAGITTVTTKSRVVVETTRLRRQMRRLAQEKKEALTQLGTRVRILVKVISESGERDHVPRAQALRVQFYSE